ncbi:hypothetical protein ACNAPP_18605 [Klebsiella pneumoniae]|uniref:hypothetical protein n=1 Tax=Klebsiella pneumoniae TaxID=573 RepID=UPI003A4D70C1
MVGYRQTNQKTDTGKTLTRWPVFVDHFSERVVDNRLNQDLKDFLGKQQTGKTDSQPIDASIHISGSVNGERELMQIMKRQQKILADIVQDANRRKM